MVYSILASASGFVIAMAFLRAADRAWRSFATSRDDLAMRSSLSVLVAVVFGYLYWTHGTTFAAGRSCALAVAMVVIAYVNRQTSLVPNVLTLPLIVLGVLSSSVGPPGLTSSLIGVAVGGGALWVLAEFYYRSTGKDGLGMGLVKLQAGIGAALGWKLMLVCFFIAAIAGTIDAMASMAQTTPAPNIRLGFHIALASVITLICGDQLLGWYLSFL